MNAIICKTLFNTYIWHPNEEITQLLYKKFIDEDISLENILFSSFLYEYNDKCIPLFAKYKKTNNVFLKKTKLTIFHSKIWKNEFLNNIQKEKILSIFCKIQKTYNGFSRFIRKYKCIKSNISVNQDLFLNPLDVKHKKTCVFFIYRSMYFFNVSDIWKIVEKAWTNHKEFDLELQMAKNPYTNIEFSKTELYNYYFHLKCKGLHIPFLLEFMFQEDFELDRFEMKYESFLLKYIIRKFIFESNDSSSRLYYGVMDMIYENKYTSAWEIHNNFPREKLVSIMRPYAYLYYLILYGKLTENQFIHISSLLYNSLYLFWKFNPKFGMEKDPGSFYDRHLPFKTRHL